jgi:hypothetical protein
MILQYRARRTGVSRVIFVAAVLLVLYGGRLLSGGRTFALQSPLFKSRVDTSSITAVFSPGSNPPPTVSPAPHDAGHDDFTRVTLPIRFDGVPSGTTVVVEMMLAEVTPPNGKPWNTLLYFGQDPPDTLWHEAPVERSLIEQVKSTPVRVHLTIQLTVLGNPQTQDVPLGTGPHRVPGIGRCALLSLPFGRFPPVLSCWAPFRQPAYVLARFNGLKAEVPREQWGALGVQWRVHYSPFPADFGIDPISDSNWAVPKGATSVAFTTMQPMAHIRRELDIPNVLLLESTP